MAKPIPSKSQEGWWAGTRYRFQSTKILCLVAAPQPFTCYQDPDPRASKRLRAIDLENYSSLIRFGKQTIVYEREDLTEIALAYGITIHKSQGSEFDAVIIPVATQHFKMLFRNLFYTGLTRAKQVCVFVGSRKAMSIAVKQVDNRKRQTGIELSGDELM